MSWFRKLFGTEAKPTASEKASPTHHVTDGTINVETRTESMSGVESLIVALKDEDWNIRRPAIDSLAKVGDGKAIEPLARAFVSESRYGWKEEEGVLNAIEAILARMPTLPKKIVRNVADVVLRAFPKVRRATSSHGARSWERSLKGASRLLGNILAVSEEARPAFARPAFAQLRYVLEDSLLTQARQDEYAFNRRDAVYSLGHIRSRKAVPFLTQALLDWLHYESLGDTSQCLRKGAAYALAEIADPATSEILVAALEIDKINPNPDDLISGGTSIRDGIQESDNDFAKMVLTKHKNGSVSRSQLREMLEQIAREDRYKETVPLIEVRTGGTRVQARSLAYMAEQARQLLLSIEKS